jgi:hypothetical protein
VKPTTTIMSCVGFLYVRRERPERRKSCVADRETPHFLDSSAHEMRISWVGDSHRSVDHTHFWQRLILDDSACAGCPSQAQNRSGKEKKP